MRDPRCGAWAITGLVLLLLGKWTALGTLPPAALLLPPVIGRWVMVLAAYSFPYVGQSGLGDYVRRGLSRRQVLVASLLTIVIVSLAARELPPLLIVFALGLLTTLIGGRWAARRLDGGLNGDVYGALCELSELLCLLGLSLWVNA
jgi:adenosylcobinamide-GDP ribazoletransferase